MFELEQAMFAEARNKPAPHGEAAGRRPEAGKSAGGEDEQVAGQDPAELMLPAGAGAASLAPAAGTDHRAAMRLDGNAATGAGTGTPAVHGTALEEVGRGEPSASGQARPWAAGLLGGTEPGGQPAGHADALGSHRIAATANLAGTFAKPVSTAYGLPAQLLAAGDVSAPMARPVERAAATFAGWQAQVGGEMHATAEAPFQEPSKAALAEGGEGRPPEPEQGEQYGARNLHLYRDGQEVRAWLRDNKVRPGQAQSVAQAVAAALAAEGALLRALTLNGKPVALSQERAAKDQDGFTEEKTRPAGVQFVKGTN